MDTKELINLLSPFIGIAAGIAIKFSDYEQLKGYRKYWLLIVLLGLGSFVLRLYSFIKN